MEGIFIVISFKATSGILVESRNISLRAKEWGGSLYIESFVPLSVVPNNWNPSSRSSTKQIIKNDIFKEILGDNKNK